LSRFVRGTAFRRGVLGTSRGWFAIWAGLGAVRFLRKRLGREPEVVERFELGSGEAVVIRDTGVSRKAFKASPVARRSV
jgi:hypothetical protein